MSPDPTGGPARATVECRRAERQPLDAPLVLHLDATAVRGQADNISRVGLMLFTDQPVRVTVHVDGVGGGRALTGRLVRLQRLDDETTGIAVEFDERIDVAGELGADR